MEPNNLSRKGLTGPDLKRFDGNQLKTIEAMARRQATLKMVASHFRISEKRLDVLFAEQPEAEEAYEFGKADGQFSLLSRAYRSQSPAMQKFLLKNFCGLTDKHTIDSNTNVTFTQAVLLLEERRAKALPAPAQTIEAEFSELPPMIQDAIIDDAPESER